MQTVAVVGASLAGLQAARALRAQGFSGDLVVVGAETRRPYDRPPLSKAFLLGQLDEADLALETDDEQLDARWLLGTPATSLDAAERRLTLSDGTQLQADGVVLATGARARALPGTAGVAGVHTLRTLDDAIALRAELVPGRRLVVIGGGFIGAETASTARALGLHVTVVEATAVPLSSVLGAEMAFVLAGLHAGHGVELACGTGVRRLVGDQRVQGVELADGRLLPADVVLVGIGALPNIEWLLDSGLDLGNGVLCDAEGITGYAGVAAVGDCAAWLDSRSGTHHRVEHWTGALERPKVAVARLLSGEGASLGRSVAPPYFWSDQYDARIQFAGVADPGDVVRIEEGSTQTGSFLAAYHREGALVAVLAVNQSREFARWRRRLAVAVAPVATG